MKTVVPRRACIGSIAVAVALCTIGILLAQSRGNVRLNENAFAFAAQLINKGHVVADSKGAWSEHRPSVIQENEFIRLNGFGAYAKWHLGIDDRYPENTKRRYKFPYGDFNDVHRCGLLAARSRAAESKYYDIENAAARLIEMVSRKKE